MGAKIYLWDTCLDSDGSLSIFIQVCRIYLSISDFPGNGSDSPPKLPPEFSIPNLKR